MKLHFITGLSISLLSLGFAACSDDEAGSNTGAETDGGTGGDTGDGSAASGGSTGDGSTGAGGAATGGGTGSGGGTATGGASGDGGADPCVKYCADSLSLCTGANEQFANETDCMTACAGYTHGSATGATLECRQAHLGFITKPADADLHCRHTGEQPVVYCL